MTLGAEVLDRNAALEREKEEAWDRAQEASEHRDFLKNAVVMLSNSPARSVPRLRLRAPHLRRVFGVGVMRCPVPVTSCSLGGCRRGTRSLL